MDIDMFLLKVKGQSNWNEKHYMKYSYTHIYTFLHFNSPSNLSSRKSMSLVGRLNLPKSVDAVEAILATCAIDKKELHYMKYSYTHIYTFLHFNSPSKLSSRKSKSLLGGLKNVLESVDVQGAICH